MMAKNLVIVESPAKATTIKKYLGSHYTVTASMGHVRDLPKSQLGVDVEHDFDPKYITIRGKGDLLSKLKREADGAGKVYLATDPDREGEAISWHLAQALGIPDDAACRITFNEITKGAVQAAIKNPRPIDNDLVDAQQARRVLDRVVGYKLSPLLWKKIKKGLSAGRVQSVTTRILVDREREIEAFVPKEYWTITAILNDGSHKASFEAKFFGVNGKKTELLSEADTKKVLSVLETAAYTVEDVKYGEKKRHAAPPFTTSTLQQEASRKLGFTSKRTMAAAQMLYEGVNVPGRGTVGLITYMRTDSLRISTEAQQEAREVIRTAFGKEYLPARAPQYKTRKGAQDAHEAIRPTMADLAPDSVKSALSADQYKLYRLIWNRFMASQMNEAIYSTVNVTVKADKYTLTAGGSKIKFKGFTALYTEGTDEEAEKEQTGIPHLEKGQALVKKELLPKQNFTEPPARFTEASLIKFMEEKGIGRPSTYAPTISTILARGYVEREKKTLIPTELGNVTTDLMKEYFPDIVNVEFTANMEEKLDDVESGDASWVAILKEFYGPFEKDLKKAEEVIDKIKLEDEVSDVICEKCGRNMVIKMGRYGKFLACPGFPACRNAKPIVVETGVPCPKCGGQIVERKSKRGKKYYACEHSPQCDFVLWDMPTKEKCPECGAIRVRKYGRGGARVVCSDPECKTNRRSTTAQKKK